MKITRLFKLITVSLGIFALILSISAPVSAAAWYTVVVKQVVPRAQENGDVYVQIEPAGGETGFTGRARILIDGTSPGASKLTNVCIAAMLLGKTMTVNTDAAPDFNNVQVLNSAGLTDQ